MYSNPLFEAVFFFSKSKPHLTKANALRERLTIPLQKKKDDAGRGGEILEYLPGQVASINWRLRWWRFSNIFDIYFFTSKSWGFHDPIGNLRIFYTLQVVSEKKPPPTSWSWPDPTGIFRIATEATKLGEAKESTLIPRKVTNIPNKPNWPLFFEGQPKSKQGPFQFKTRGPHLASMFLEWTGTSYDSCSGALDWIHRWNARPVIPRFTTKVLLFEKSGGIPNETRGNVTITVRKKAP